MFRACLFLCAFIVSESNAGVAPFLNPCVWNDKKCILESSKATLNHIGHGSSEFNIPSLNVVHVKEVDSSTGELKLKFKNMKVEGMAKSELLRVERPNPDKNVNLEFKFPVHVTGEYDVKGKVFVLEVFGNGDFDGKTDILIKAEFKITTIEKNGKKYYKITGFDYTFEPLTDVSFHFGNLYNGDESKSKIFTDLAAQNGKELLVLIGKPLIDEVIKQEATHIQKFLLQIPIDELQKTE